MRQIIAELRAAERMRQRVHAVDFAAEALLGDVGNAARRSRDAADCAHHPELIACSHASVAAPITHESARLRRTGASGRRGRRVLVVGMGSERGSKIVRMDMLARRDIARGAADGPAVLADEAPGSDRAYGDLVPTRYRGTRDDRIRAGPYRLSRLQIAQGDEHVILRMYPQRIG